MRYVLMLLAALAVCSGCGRAPTDRRLTNADRHSNKIVARARLEVTRKVAYDASYRKLTYPNGDVAPNRGSCADVIVRAFRATGRDLQKLIFEDETAHPKAYRCSRPDPSIDHRRSRNQIVYFSRHAKTLTNDASRLSEWRPGDVVYWDLGNGLQHTGIISDAKSPSGGPLVIHNIGPVAAEEDVLTAWQIIGHFRF